MIKIFYKFSLRYCKIVRQFFFNLLWIDGEKVSANEDSAVYVYQVHKDSALAILCDGSVSTSLRSWLR